MNNNNCVFIAILLATCFAACNGAQNAVQQDEAQQALHVGDNSQTSVDWAGVYQGVLPCADCPGISTVVYLNEDGTYNLQTQYLERSDSVHHESGTFEWNQAGGKITLLASGNRRFLVGENQIIHLDMEGNRIEGDLAPHYVLKKADVSPLDIYWKLVEIEGSAVEESQTRREPYMRLLEEENRVEGTGGCNGFGGTFEFKEPGSLSFNGIFSTKMACPEMEIEYRLLAGLETVVSYTQNENILTLYTDEEDQFAVFEAVYGK